MQNIRTFLMTALCTTGVALAALPAVAQTTERVSVSSNGDQANGESLNLSISADGRYVAFSSGASNLVVGDTNGINQTPDIFVRDRQIGTTTRVSVASDGTQANNRSFSPSLSADGRFVAFVSEASNLVPNDTNNTHQFAFDVFVHDRQTGTTSRVSVASDGTQGQGASYNPSISADGRFVAFVSEASNLVPNDANDRPDVFVHDRQTGSTSRVSVASNGWAGDFESYDPSISADGRFVAFQSFGNLVDNDTNFLADVYVHDRQTATTSRVSIASNGSEGDSESSEPFISADGRFVTFVSGSSLAPNDTNQGTLDVYVHDRLTGTTTLVSVASDGTQATYGSYSSSPSITDDGRFVVFASDASSLVPNDTPYRTWDVFVHDRQTGSTSRVSGALDGTTANNSVDSPSMSTDGRFVAFSSAASNLVPNDTNDRRDIFVHDRGPQEVVTFLGFEKPVQDLPFTNSVKAGRTIPIKWQLTDETGGYIRDLAIVKSVKFADVACDSQDLDYENPVDAQAAGGSRLRYDRADEHFIYTWKTQRSMSNSCAVLILTLANNQQHFARFMLK